MPTKTRSVLVVDDDGDNRANLKDILEQLGYRADTAADGPTALDLIRQHCYDVALLDFRMPEMDGVTLFGEMRKLQPSIVAIMVTAYAGDDGVRRAKEAGTWKVLSKPVDVSCLLPLVDEAARNLPR